MKRKVLYSIFTLVQFWVQTASLDTTSYFHLNSRIEFRPEDGISDSTDFGFSIAYQSKQSPVLVVGSPHGSQVGNVYTCPMMTNNLKENNYLINCKKMHLDISKFKYNKADKNQNFCFGATVLATPEYILACAPLWTSVTYRHKGVQQGSFGTCFAAFDNSFRQINDLLKQHSYNSTYKHSKEIFFKSIYGGVGWSVLLDPSNELILIGKPGVNGDIQFISSALKDNDLSKSLFFNGTNHLRDSESYFDENPYNIGFAMTSGYFFKDFNSSVIAFSLQGTKREGKVSFLWYNRNKTMLKIVEYKNKKMDILYNNVPGSLFGAALWSADVNHDGISDLLIGEPAQAQHGNHAPTYDVGAICIYLGADMATFIKSKPWIILGEVEGSRFGTTIASSDLDGDHLPEIFVSAPFEADSGALYILSGFEINGFMKSGADENYVVHLSKLKLTQKIVMEPFKWLGYSLQILPSTGDNDCKDLAVGSPKSSRVVLLHCIDAINATLTAGLVSENVKETDYNFTVKVCVVLSNNWPKKKSTSRVFVNSEITGYGAEIKKPTFEIDVTKTTTCQNVVIDFKYSGGGIYTFSSNLTSNLKILMEKTDFDPSWVRLSPYSSTAAKFTVRRHCIDNDCSAHLKFLPIVWNGLKVHSNVTEHLIKDGNSVKVTISVVNEGSAVYESCMRLRIDGAQILSIECSKEASSNAYLCYPPRPFIKNETYILNFLLGMTKNDVNTVRVEAALYSNCNYRNDTLMQLLNVSVIYSIEDVVITGNSRSFEITDTQLLNTEVTTIEDRHEYIISNKDSLNWEGIDAILSMPVYKYVKHYWISSSENGVRCNHEPRYSNSTVQFNCIVNLYKNSTETLIVTIEIEKNKIVDNLESGLLEISSNVTLFFKPTAMFNTVSQNTTILYRSEMSFGNNKNLIIALAIIGALIILAIISFALYKAGFFQRKEKVRLEEAKRNDSIGQSMKQSTYGANDDNKPKNELELEMEVVEECFQPVSCPEGALILPDKSSSSKTKMN